MLRRDFFRRTVGAVVAIAAGKAAVSEPAPIPLHSQRGVDFGWFPDPDAEIVAECRRRYNDCLSKQMEQIASAKQDLWFHAGDQWTQSERYQRNPL